jgi:hypothetical protein
MTTPVEDHCAEVNRCNQRGGRMLSVFDLIERGTLDIGLAAFLMARISQGASFLVGARPGGAGKTTAMGALLGLIPAGRRIIPATRESLASIPRAADGNDLCVVCHEISPGNYYSYLWGQDLRDYCSLVERGCMLATNLHADTLGEARKQVCGDNGVPVERFNAFAVQIYLRVDAGFGKPQRRIESVYVSDGKDGHQVAFSASEGVSVLKNALAREDDMSRFDQCRDFLKAAYDRNVRTIEEVRESVLEFLQF